MCAFVAFSRTKVFQNGATRREMGVDVVPDTHQSWSCQRASGGGMTDKLLHTDRIN